MLPPNPADVKPEARARPGPPGRGPASGARRSSTIASAEAAEFRQPRHAVALRHHCTIAARLQVTAPDGRGPLEVVDDPPRGGDLASLAPDTDVFIPDYRLEEIQEIAMKLYQKAGG